MQRRPFAQGFKRKRSEMPSPDSWSSVSRELYDRIHQTLMTTQLQLATTQERCDALTLENDSLRQRLRSQPDVGNDQSVQEARLAIQILNANFASSINRCEEKFHRLAQDKEAELKALKTERRRELRDFKATKERDIRSIQLAMDELKALKDQEIRELRESKAKAEEDFRMAEEDFRIYRIEKEREFIALNEANGKEIQKLKEEIESIRSRCQLNHTYGHGGYGLAQIRETISGETVKLSEVGPSHRIASLIISY
ncbi:hypothetical protein ONZ45_g16459 [Pleurotus djamor]|nr:hypothetical protein ONZ45_g16459 [Pleurotus djamor]